MLVVDGLIAARIHPDQERFAEDTLYNAVPSMMFGTVCCCCWLGIGHCSCTTLHHHPTNNNNNNHSNNKMIVLLGDGGSEPTEGRGVSYVLLDLTALEVHVLRCIKGSVFSEAFLERASQAKHRLSCGCARNYCHVLRRIKVGAF
eukprot:scaffold9096_cov82-Skeletonema_marinoi.AAC.1